jgi:cytochrome bd ubiquinol oxidase subunit I
MITTLASAASDLDLLAARNQMAVSLGFHIVFAALGIGFPLITLLAHRRGLRRGDPDALALAKRWSKTMAVLFAVGAVSGTVLSFEMGILWPGLMGPFGDVIGLPFTLEGVSFFTEAIFIAIYLYGWKGMAAKWHYRALYPIVVAGITGSFFIVAVNGWMNSPAGFDLAASGAVVNVDPLAAMFNGAVAVQWIHMLFAAYMVSGFLVAGVYAWAWLRGRREHAVRLGFTIAFSVAAVAAPLQVAVGDIATRRLIDAQPAKFAAMELLPETQSNAPLTLGGRLVDGEVVGAIEIPGVASFLGARSFDAEVPGLDAVPVDERPSDRAVNLVHWTFQLMVAIGTGLLALAAWFGWVRWRRRRLPDSPWFWRAAAVSGFAAVAAMELGWITTEVGRQPWVVQGILRTADAVSGASGLVWSLTAVTAIYLVLGTVTVLVLRRIADQFRSGEDVATPYGPPLPAEGR